MSTFTYSEAFSRNIGWVTPSEQEVLRTRRVAIAGLGGVGGAYLLSLARLGVGRFSIADFDAFEVANFNRQVGASMPTVGHPKVDVLMEMALDINPELVIATYPSGVTKDNLNDFLQGADLYLDGLDYFAVEARRLVFAGCNERGIPAVTAAPLGMSVAALSFLPGKPSFEDYFQLEGYSEQKQLLRFLLGLSPAMLQMGYLVHPEAVNLAQHRGPSTIVSCDLCAGVACAQALKILLKRGKVWSAPHGLQFDAYRNKYVHTWRPGGNNNPLQRLAFKIAERKLARAAAASTTTTGQDFQPSSTIEKVLDLARWAPSGDNSQPWRFHIVNERDVIVRCRDEADISVYDYNDGQPSWLSFGCLLENTRIAASRFAQQAQWELIDSRDHVHEFRVSLSPTEDLAEDPLLPYLVTRSVDRRPYQRLSLSAHQKQELEGAAGEHIRIHWSESFAARWQWAKINALATSIRLSIREAHLVHKRILDWENRFSPDKVPATAVGIDPLTRRAMHWLMQDWRRIDTFNRFLGGTLTPMFELDIVPGLCCAAHFFLETTGAGKNERLEWLAVGAALQRIWLTADQLGLVMQPSLAPLGFGFYGRNDIEFTASSKARTKASRLARRLRSAVAPADPENVMFLARIGVPRPSTAKSRSLRLSLQELLV